MFLLTIPSHVSLQVSQYWNIFRWHTWFPVSSLHFSVPNLKQTNRKQKQMFSATFYVITNVSNLNYAIWFGRTFTSQKLTIFLHSYIFWCLDLSWYSTSRIWTCLETDRETRNEQAQESVISSGEVSSFRFKSYRNQTKEKTKYSMLAEKVNAKPKSVRIRKSSFSHEMSLLKYLLYVCKGPSSHLTWWFVYAWNWHN